jgi:uncharacterized protein (UPF0264 family)
MPRLIVSVRNRVEAQDALAGGADLLDVKEPTRGSLGAPDLTDVADILGLAAGRCPVSAALGELIGYRKNLIGLPVSYLKWGLAGCAGTPEWPERFFRLVDLIRTAVPEARPVAVAYADWQRAQAPSPHQVLEEGRKTGCSAFLIDTCIKDGRGILSWFGLPELRALRAAAHDQEMEFALAGSLQADDIPAALELAPEWIAVRGAVCRGGRKGPLCREKVSQLSRLFQPFSQIDNSDSR